MLRNIESTCLSKTCSQDLSSNFNQIYSKQHLGHGSSPFIQWKFQDPNFRRYLLYKYQTRPYFMESFPCIWQVPPMQILEMAMNSQFPHLVDWTLNIYVSCPALYTKYSKVWSLSNMLNVTIFLSEMRYLMHIHYIAWHCIIISYCITIYNLLTFVYYNSIISYCVLCNYVQSYCIIVCCDYIELHCTILYQSYHIIQSHYSTLITVYTIITLTTCILHDVPQFQQSSHVQSYTLQKSNMAIYDPSIAGGSAIISPLSIH